MKNKPFKKILSVFLAVLMVMSAWVFAVPEQTYAADETQTGGSETCNHSYTGAVKNNMDGTHSKKCVSGCGQYGATEPCEYVDTTVAPNCYQKGYTLHKCTVCNYTNKDNETEKTAHNWSAWRYVEGADCKDEDSQVRYCLTQGCTAAENQVVADSFGPHAIVIVKGKAPTCTENGSTDYSRCVTCGYIESSNLIPKLDHPDNNKDGNCDVCDKLLSPNGTCGCLCHSEFWLAKLFYGFANFFWELFGIREVCDCGYEHW